MWGDVRCGEMCGRCSEMWGDVRRILATSRMSLSPSASESLPTSCTISVRSSSTCRISLTVVRRGGNCGQLASYHGSSGRRYLE